MKFFSQLFAQTKTAESHFKSAFEAETKHNNYKLAASLYEKAARMGMGDAQFYAGLIFIKGRGVQKNFPKGVELLNMAATENHPKAQYLLAQMYFSGEGVVKNSLTAEKWMDRFNLHEIPFQSMAITFHNF